MVWPGPWCRGPPRRGHLHPAAPSGSPQDPKCPAPLGQASGQGGRGRAGTSHLTSPSFLLMAEPTVDRAADVFWPAWESVS